jgi:hypothetical protein
MNDYAAVVVITKPTNIVFTIQPVLIAASFAIAIAAATDKQARPSLIALSFITIVCQLLSKHSELAIVVQ